MNLAEKVEAEIARSRDGDETRVRLVVEEVRGEVRVGFSGLQFLDVPEDVQSHILGAAEDAVDLWRRGYIGDVIVNRETHEFRLELTEGEVR